jgi:hypothetical protein
LIFTTNFAQKENNSILWMNNAPNTSALNGHVAFFATSSVFFFFFFLNNAPNTSTLNGHVASFAISSIYFSYHLKEMVFFFFFFFLQVVDWKLMYMSN